jgi:hypothetical protein
MLGAGLRASKSTQHHLESYTRAWTKGTEDYLSTLLPTSMGAADRSTLFRSFHLLYSFGRAAHYQLGVAVHGAFN